MNILITGGSRGIGEATVRLLIKKGHSVVFTFNSNQKRAELICEETGAKAVHLDLFSSSSINSLSDQILKSEFDVLINNACPSSKLSLLSKIESKELTQYLSSGIEVVHELSKAFVKSRKKQTGRIINILSAYTLTNVQSQMAPYIALKHALLGLTKCMAKEYQTKNIIVNAVSPSMTKTDFLVNTFPEKFIDLAQSEHPLRELANPEEIAEIISFLVSSNRYLHGVNIPITGGV